jgi:hypothetical protein
MNLAYRLEDVIRGDHRDQSPSRDDKLSKMRTKVPIQVSRTNAQLTNACSPNDLGGVSETDKANFVAETFIKGTHEVLELANVR